MGCLANLDIGNLSVDWSKNSLNDHGELFLPGDLTEADYHYVGDDDEPLAESKEAYSRRLGDILPRLELLGWTLEALRRDHDGELPFDVLVEVFGHVDLVEGSRTRDVWSDIDHSFKDELYSCLAKGVGAERAQTYEDSLWEAVETLEPCAILRLLAESPRNLDVPVVWRFADVVEGGYVEPEDVYRPLHTRDQFLIVTEGSSDANVLQKAFSLRRPRVADFFYFVDMKENYPFSGTGNQFNFAKGLARIRIENRVIVLFDNDAEGTSKLSATASLELPTNIRAIGLPVLAEFERFTSLGPNGEATSDINRRAASIECYLDLDWRMTERPAVRWTAYQSNTDTYQGALVNKEAYTKAFLKFRDGVDDSYDFHKMDAVLDAIISTAVSMATVGDGGAPPRPS